jgi:glycosyltransferase involved in cell wall biosynthesis
MVAMSTPLITLCLPIYNAERFLAECIRSIQAQTLADFRVIAVLDGCQDRSEEILMELKDERFTVIKKDRNEGVVVASNLVIEQTTTPFGGRMDADDIMLPERLEKQQDFLLSHPDVDVVGTWFDYINEHSQKIRDAFPFPANHDDIKAGFRVRNSIGGCTVLFRSERIKQLGGYTDQDPFAEDLNLWLKCLANGYQFANIPEVLLRYRLSDGQLSKDKQKETWAMSNVAYRRYGRLIWGDNDPELEIGAPLHRRIMRKLKHLLRTKR